MPQGVAVFVEHGLATIDFIDPALKGRGIAALLEHTPADLVEKMTRSGPRVLYRVPEGNARDAGLLDEVSQTDVPFPDRADLGFAQALVEANPNAGGETHWHAPLHTVDGHTYVAGRDGANGAISGPLRPNKPVADAPAVPAIADLGSADLQVRIRENTPAPADYAATGAPREHHAPAGQATIATVITNPFERAIAENADVEAGADLASLTVPKLKAYAKKREIDLDGATKKDDILAKIADASS